MATRENPIRAEAGTVDSSRTKLPRIVLLHYTAPPIVGGVEMVMAEHNRLFSAAGYPTTIIAGRQDSDKPTPRDVVLIPQMDSEHAEYLALKPALDAGNVTPEFHSLQANIESALRLNLRPDDIVIVHNALTMHFNMALTAAIHHLVEQRIVRHLIVWCHDIARYVNPDSPSHVPQRFGFPWDFLRTYRPDLVYVCVSPQRQRLLASILHCSTDAIRVIPNGVEPMDLLALSSPGQQLADDFGLLSADLVILMPIRITRAKNIGFAIRVAAALKKAGLKIRLIITGPPDPHVLDIQDHYAELRNLQHTLSLDEEVVFIHEGTQRHAAPVILEASVVAELYRLCDMVLMPSLREGFGLPVLEAGMADKPVFATRMPVMEILGDAQYVIQPDESPESVAARILEWSAVDAAHRLRRSVRQEFTWSSIFSTKIEPLIKSMSVAEWLK